MVEEITTDVEKYQFLTKDSLQRPKTLFNLKAEQDIRVKTGFEEFDRILGGGIVKGSVVLVGGAPGIGKSTLLLQLSDQLSLKGQTILYVSGEESIDQTKLRADRLRVNSQNLYILSETNLDLIAGYIKELSPQLVVIDSIQVVYKPDLESAPGSVSQVKESAGQFVHLAKSSGIPIFLIGHVTKEGSIAGPRVLEHMVDTVLYFEGESYHSYRVLRAIKNRFGSTNEIGVFKMQEGGLRQVLNPSELFLAERPLEVTGSTVVPVLEGTRVILVELQALLSPVGFSLPSRRSSGIDYNRVSLLLAVLEKRVGLKISGFDSFVSVAGGIKITEPATDLGVCISCASSLKDIPTKTYDVMVGEVGLGGEVRAVSHIVKRIKEAEKLGFKRSIVPQGNFKGLNFKGKIEVIGVRTVKEALEVAFS
jgi:DNA repair protein RadA/Sms